MISSIELQVISAIITSTDEDLVKELLSYDESFYSVFKPQIKFILEHNDKYHDTPDVFTFQAQYPDITLVAVTETKEFLTSELRKNKQHIILLDTFNKLKDLGSGDVREAWEYIGNQFELASSLDDAKPLNLVKDSEERAELIKEYAKQSRIPTGFKEIDDCLYGGLSTVEELFLVVARTNHGKSWVCTKMMESAQANGFPVLCYSPEMQGAYLATRFDTWRSHFENNQLYLGRYTEQYIDYLKALREQKTDAFILEDKDAPGNTVNIPFLANLVRKHKIKLLIIDGLSYLEDVKKSDTDYIKYKNLCLDLFKLSKTYGCAVVVAAQANRASLQEKDDKGECFPTLANLEGSDHPGRICTQAIAIRQIFDKHVLDIRLEKSRTAKNQKPVFSYSWDVNTGNMKYIPSDEDNTVEYTQPAASPKIISNQAQDVNLADDSDDDEDVEF